MRHLVLNFLVTGIVASFGMADASECVDFFKRPSANASTLPSNLRASSALPVAPMVMDPVPLTRDQWKKYLGSSPLVRMVEGRVIYSNLFYAVNREIAHDQRLHFAHETPAEIASLSDLQRGQLATAIYLKLIADEVRVANQNDMQFARRTLKNMSRDLAIRNISETLSVISMTQEFLVFETESKGKIKNWIRGLTLAPIGASALVAGVDQASLQIMGGDSAAVLLIASATAAALLRKAFVEDPVVEQSVSLKVENRILSRIAVEHLAAQAALAKRSLLIPMDEGKYTELHTVALADAERVQSTIENRLTNEDVLEPTIDLHLGVMFSFFRDYFAWYKASEGQLRKVTENVRRAIKAGEFVDPADHQALNEFKTYFLAVQKAALRADQGSLVIQHSLERWSDYLRGNGEFSIEFREDNMELLVNSLLTQRQFSQNLRQMVIVSIRQTLRGIRGLGNAEAGLLNSRLSHSITEHNRALTDILEGLQLMQQASALERPLNRDENHGEDLVDDIMNQELTGNEL